MALARLAIFRSDAHRRSIKIEVPGKVSEVTWKAGQTYQRPAGVEHDELNASEHPLAFVEIEIKRPEELVLK